MTHDQERERVPAYENCPTCSGTGLTLNMAGEADNCPHCWDGLVRSRDEKGRFKGNTAAWIKEVQP